MTASISTLDRIDLKILDILQDDGKYLILNWQKQLIYPPPPYLLGYKS